MGQPDAGILTGGDFELAGGFWFRIETGDCNTDGVVDLFDYAAFQGCYTGPGGPVGPGCECFDLNADGDVDLIVFGVFQALHRLE